MKYFLLFIMISSIACADDNISWRTLSSSSDANIIQQTKAPKFLKEAVGRRNRLKNKSQWDDGFCTGVRATQTWESRGNELLTINFIEFDYSEIPHYNINCKQ